jgi:hypothetical protein
MVIRVEYTRCSFIEISSFVMASLLTRSKICCIIFI